MKCDIHAYNMLYNSVRFCIFKRPAVHCYCCFSLGYTKKHTYFHISFSNENGLGNLIANPWLFWPPEDALIFLLSLERLCVQITTKAKKFLIKKKMKTWWWWPFFYSIKSWVCYSWSCFQPSHFSVSIVNSKKNSVLTKSVA